MKRNSKSRLKKAIFGCLFAIMGLVTVLTGSLATTPAYADPVTEPTYVETATEENTDEAEGDAEAATETEGATTANGNSCEDSLGSLGWLVCPTTGKISEAVDWLYDKIEGILAINPVEAKDGQPIYEIWKYFRGVTNVVFIIFLLVVIYSQITGVGISNYGVKRALPKLIVAAILVNLSFVICSLLVDVSNVIGNGLRGFMESIEVATTANMQFNYDTTSSNVMMAEMYSAMAGGTAIAIGAGAIAFESGAIWMLIPVALGAIVAVASGLITIALRQAVVALLIMIAPLAIVAYILPNTEQWFKKWKQLLTRMLVFYPAFSLLFGASSLAGWAIIASATDGFGVLLGVAVRVFPLFFSWKLMKMSGTFLESVNMGIRRLASGPLATNRAWAESHRELTKQKYLASSRAYTPTLRLRQFLANRRISREEETREYAETVKNRGLAYNAKRNYKGGDLDGTLSRKGRRAYEAQARNMGYQHSVLRHSNNMNKGFGYRAKEGTAERARLDSLDMQNVRASDRLAVERARGEKIEYENAVGLHQRMEAAINSHMDSENRERASYKQHFESEAAYRAALERYNEFKGLMEGNIHDVQFAAASAAQAYDTQAKMIMTKFQKYFELTPPTKDVEFRLGELTKQFAEGEKVADRIDAIIPGLRILNQRGDTDLVKEQLDNILNEKLGGGIELGTHASQSLASFLMFEVKDNDPFLRRFGKYINLETARAYNSNDRKEMAVTYDEYVKGYHEEPDGNIMYAKKAMRQLVEGTSLDNVERTAFSNLDESLKKAYGFDKNNPNAKWDIEGYLRKREEIQTAFEPAFLSASLKWLSGSEQINSGVKFWTGYELKQKKDENGNIVVDENGDPEYDLEAVWNDNKSGFAGHEEEVEKFFRRKTGDYFKDQTTGQILGMRTDYRDPTMEHLVNLYLEDSSNEEDSDERKRKYEEQRAEIQTRYSDKSPEEAKKLRDKDMKQLKMEMAGKQLRKILGETGKLKQIYRTRTSGTAINAKDWLRRWVNLDDEDALRREMNFYDEKRKGKNEEEKKGADSHEDEVGMARIYSAEDRERFLNEMRDLKDEIMDEETELFFEATKDQLVEWFGENTVIVKKYEKYYEEGLSSADNIDLYKYLRELLEDPDNYPDA